MSNEVLLLIGIASVFTVLFIVYCLYSIHLNTVKNKKLLFAILSLLAKQNKDSENPIDLKELYEKGRNL